MNGSYVVAVGRRDGNGPRYVGNGPRYVGIGPRCVGLGLMPGCALFAVFAVVQRPRRR